MLPLIESLTCAKELSLARCFVGGLHLVFVQYLRLNDAPSQR